MNPAQYNPYMQCPYNRAHQVPKLKMQMHLVKCKKNNPHLASLLRTCPYNATHIMPAAEFFNHLQSCQDSSPIQMYSGEREPGEPSFHPPAPSGGWVDSDEDEQHPIKSSPEVSIPCTSHDRDESLPGGALGISLQPNIRENRVVPLGGFGRGDKIKKMLAQSNNPNT